MAGREPSTWSNFPQRLSRCTFPAAGVAGCADDYDGCFSYVSRFGQASAEGRAWPAYGLAARRTLPGTVDTGGKRRGSAERHLVIEPLDWLDLASRSLTRVAGFVDR